MKLRTVESGGAKGMTLPSGCSSTQALRRRWLRNNINEVMVICKLPRYTKLESSFPGNPRYMLSWLRCELNLHIELNEEHSVPHHVRAPAFVSVSSCNQSLRPSGLELFCDSPKILSRPQPRNPRITHWSVSIADPAENSTKSFNKTLVSPRFRRHCSSTATSSKSNVRL